jgi:hypothetical protein
VPKSPALTAESLTDLCLGHLAQDPELLGEFMGVAGYSPAGLRAAIGSEQLGRGLIDYFAQTRMKSSGRSALLLHSARSSGSFWAK